MHEEKIALVDGQVKAVQQAVAARAVENVYFVACGVRWPRCTRASISLSAKRRR